MTWNLQSIHAGGRDQLIGLSTQHLKQIRKLTQTRMVDVSPEGAVLSVDPFYAKYNTDQARIHDIICVILAERMGKIGIVPV